MSCKHEAFGVRSRVARLVDSGGFMLELEVRCTQCKLPFHFLGMDLGLSFTKPTTGADRTELRAPIAPGSDLPLSPEERMH